MDKPLHIAFLTPEYVTEPKFDGGLANYLQRVCLALLAAGHQPEIFVATDRNETLRHRGLTVHRVQTFTVTTRMCMRIFSGVMRIPWSLTWESLCMARAISKRFDAVHASHPFDVVQASDFQAPGLLIGNAIPLVTRLSYFSPLWRPSLVSVNVDRRAREYLEGLVVKRAVCAYAPSRFIAETAGMALRRQLDILPPPVFLDEGTPGSLTLPGGLQFGGYVLYFGRVCRLKGAHILGPCIVDILRDLPQLKLVIVGREDPVGILDDIRNSLGREADRLIYFPRMKHQDLYPIIRGAAVVCLPSVFDNFPNTCVEAMSLGRIVVGTRDRGFDELIEDKVSGFLAEMNNPASFENAIRAALSMTVADRRDMEHAAIKSIARYHPDKNIPILVEYFRQSIRMHRVAKGGG